MTQELINPISMPVRQGIHYPKAVRVSARALYETTPGMSLPELSKQTGIKLHTLVSWKREDGWVQRRDLIALGTLPEAAQEAADRYQVKIDDLGPEITSEQESRAADEVVIETAVDLRAQVIDRHRKELSVPRTLIAEALSIRKTDHAKAFELAKLAKITSETIKIVQDAERKAWGLDPLNSGEKVYVSIDREKVQ